MLQIPENFLIKTNHAYPPGNHMIFEQYFYERFCSELPETNRVYLPVQWTNFYISRDYSVNNTGDLQNFLNSLDRSKKYFTVIQWDDGVLNDVSGLDLKVFASGGVGDYPIPLINMPHEYSPKTRDIFASFLGCIFGRHPIREKMFSHLHQKEGYAIFEKTNFFTFKDVMERSIFALCPRGYGKTSFRINEALNLGAIPVYMYDDPWIPFFDLIDFKEYGILIHESEVEKTDEILKSYSENDIARLVKNGKIAYENYYKYNSCYDRIIGMVK